MFVGGSERSYVWVGIRLVLYACFMYESAMKVIIYLRRDGKLKEKIEPGDHRAFGVL